MSEISRRVFGLAEFLLWELGEERRFELVDGEAVMMAGGTQAHALIATNIVYTLRSRLRGGPCRPFGSDLRLPIPATGNSRYLDVTVDCGSFDPGAHDASKAAVVFEVLSDSTGWYDQTRKLRDYDSIPSIKQYVCVSQSEQRLLVWRRDSSGRLVPDDVIVDGMLALDLGMETVELPLAEIYEGTDLPGGNATAG